MIAPTVVISSRGVERLASGHPWIYRSDVVKSEGIEPGVVRLIDQKNCFWGQALYSSQSQIALRFLTRYARPIGAAFLTERIHTAAAFRQQVATGAQAYRLVAAEGDLLPSLIIDRYGDCFVIQTLSQGMDRLKSTVVEILQKEFAPARSWSAMMPPCAASRVYRSKAGCWRGKQSAKLWWKKTA
jgi:23S rRNA (cytosine1962-C5)-methyltransferase